VDKEVSTRTHADMNVEMAQELPVLPRFTAYARLIEEKDGQQRVLKEKIKTIALPKITEGAREEAGKRRKVIEENSGRYLKKREVIEEEIRMRQERWTGGGSLDKAPPRRGEDRGDEARKGDPPPRSSRPPPE
jgi:hypothetical protein